MYLNKCYNVKTGNVQIVTWRCVTHLQFWSWCE